MRDENERKRSGATIHDVAKLAGVSIITVSRALNAPERVSAKTLERVRKAVEHTSYVPNLMAGGLRSARSRLVMALVPTLTGELFVPPIQALTRSLEAHGYQLMLGQVGYADSREDRLLDAIIGRRPDGIVLTGILHSPQGRKRLIASGIPVVETWDYTPTPIDTLVGFSHAKVGREVAEFLAARGRRRLAMIIGNDARARQRIASFVETSARLGLANPEVEVVQAPGTHASGRECFARIMARAPETDAVFCNDMIALGVMTEARERGIAIPRQVAIVGFGDLDFAKSTSPALTTVRIDGDEIGRLAAEFIVARAQGRDIAEPVVDIGFTIVERGSA